MSTVISAPIEAPAAAAVDHAAFQAVLEALRADCVGQRELALAESATAMPDPVAVSRAGRLLDTIQQIDGALRRIADGSYARCVHCGLAIPVERLEFRPFA